MNNPANSPALDEDTLQHATRDEIMSALFASMIMQQSQMAFMLLGRTPHPETGQVVRDLEGAKMFIDQLEMIEAKTRGNLDRNEESLLKQSLAALRMAFVEAVDRPSAGPMPAPTSTVPAADAPTVEAGSPADDSKKRFSKKY